MLRHRAFIQAARLAFGFAGIYDETEARDIVHMGEAEVVEEPRRKGTAGLKAAMRRMQPPSPPPAELEPHPPDAPISSMAEPEIDALFDRIANGIRQAIDRADAEQWLVVAADELPEPYQREMVMIFSENWERDSSGDSSEDDKP